MVRSVMTYVAHDDKVFDTQEKATKHEREIDFYSWYNSLDADKLPIHSGTGNPSMVLCYWLESHRDEILKFYGKQK